MERLLPAIPRSATGRERRRATALGRDDQPLQPHLGIPLICTASDGHPGYSAATRSWDVARVGLERDQRSVN